MAFRSLSINVTGHCCPCPYSQSTPLCLKWTGVPRGTTYLSGIPIRCAEKTTFLGLWISGANRMHGVDGRPKPRTHPVKLLVSRWVRRAGFDEVGSGFAANRTTSWRGAAVGRGSLLVTSNRAMSEWGEVVRDAAVATTILDRLLHHSHVLTRRGDSYRPRTKRQSEFVKPSSAAIEQPFVQS